MGTLHRSEAAGHRVRSLLLALALAATVVALPAGAAQAATCKVNSTNDPTESQIQDIIDNTAPNGTVTFSGTCFGTFTIDGSLKVVGLGSNATVDGEAAGTVFSVASALTVSFTNLTISDGDSTGHGGGIVIDEGTVATFTRMRFVGNESEWLGGALFGDSFSTMTVTSSTFTGNRTLASGQGGAAIGSNNARLTVTGSTFTDNRGDAGGAIYAEGCSNVSPAPLLPVVISRSTFARNVSTFGDAGAVYLDTVPATISASTFSGNEATGIGHGGAITVYDDVCNGDAPTTIVGSTFTRNTSLDGGGAIFSTYASAPGNATGGPLSVRSSKFISNTGFEGGAIALIGVEGVEIASSTFSGNAAWGGAGGAVHGYGLWPSDDGVRIDRSTFTGNRAPSSGGAVALYNGNWSSVAITGSTFTRNAAGQHDYWGFGYWEMREGGGAVYTQGYHLSATASTFSSNTAIGSGGAIYFNGFFEGSPSDCGELVLSRTTIKGNASSLGDGGGLFANGYYSAAPGDCTNVSIEASVISGNAAEDGGGVYLDGYVYDVYSDIDWDQSGTLVMDASSRVDGNRAASDGGGIYAEDWHLLLQGSVSGNIAAVGEGGGLYVRENYLTHPLIAVTNAKFDRNTAFGLGGGIRVDGDGALDFAIADELGPVSISYNKLTSAFGRGGGVYATNVSDFGFLTDGFIGGDPTVTIAYNVAKDGGGGLYVTGLTGSGDLDDGLLITRNSVGGLYDRCLFSLGGAVITGNAGYDFLPESCT